MGGNEHGEGFASRAEERRAHPRYLLDEECLLLLVNHGMPVKGRVVDLSATGCRVRAAEPFAAKAGRTVEISFKVKGFAFRFCGVVRWSDGDRVIGLHFENMIPRRKVELVEVIEEMAAAVAARPQAVPHLAAEQEAAQEPPRPDAVQSEPAPEKARASGPPAAAGAFELPAQIHVSQTSIQPETEASAAAKMEPLAPQPAKPRDRRTQARHEIDSTATIFLVKVASALRGRIVDLSLGGCRIRTDEKFPVGIYTRVEIEFHLQGLPFRLGGVIQAIHNRNTVGIRLLDLSERKRQQVQDLIDELDEMCAEMPPAEDGSAEEQHQTGGR